MEYSSFYDVYLRLGVMKCVQKRLDFLLSPVLLFFAEEDPDLATRDIGRSTEFLSYVKILK